METLVYICMAVWFIVAVISLVIEIETFQLVSVWFIIGSIGAIITAPIAPANALGVVIQITVFLVLSIISMVAFRPLAKRKMKVDPEANKDINSMIGLTGIALTDIDSLDGSASISGTTWKAVSKDTIKKDAKIRIVKQDNLLLYVEEIK